MRYQNLFENQTARLSNISKNDIKRILPIVVNTFKGHGMNDNQIIDYTLKTTNWTISKKLVIGNRIIGFYLLKPDNIENNIDDTCKILGDLNKFKNKRGVKGVALVVLPEFRGSGYGNLLKDLPKTLGFDYVFGFQFKSIGNLDQWLKRRKLIADCGDEWITAELF